MDTELLLLVDSTQRGLARREFDELLDSYAAALTSSGVLDAIQAGSYGRIAVSMMFFGDAGTQVVGIPWMSVGSAAEAETFAILLRTVTRPQSPGTIQLDDALLAAIPLFGAETGGTDNGFESSTQIIEVAGASTPPGGSASGVPEARDRVLASGVDLINAIAVGGNTGAMEAFYVDNVIGGEAGGVVATSSSSALDGSLTGFLAGRVSHQVNAGAAESLALVPEPSAFFALLSGFGLLCLRRRRY